MGGLGCNSFHNSKQDSYVSKNFKYKLTKLNVWKTQSWENPWTPEIIILYLSFAYSNNLQIKLFKVIKHWREVLFYPHPISQLVDYAVNFSSKERHPCDQNYGKCVAQLTVAQCFSDLFCMGRLNA